MKWLVAVSGMLACVGTARAQTRADVEASRRAVEEAMQADARGDVDGAVRWLSEALTLRPGHPDLHFALAGAMVQGDDMDGALRNLTALATMGMAPDPSADPRFAPLNGEPRFEAIVGRLAENRRPHGEAHDFMLVPVAGDFIPEGLAYDPEGRAHYLGSVRKRTILRLRPRMPPDTLAPPGFQGLASVLGMVVDPVRRDLWVCSTGLPQTEGLEESQAGRSAVFRFDLETGALIVTYHFSPGDQRARAIGDIEIDDDGRIYLSDGIGSAMYTIRPGGDFIETFVQPETFVSPQGIAAPPGVREIYVADYSRGVYRVDKATRTVEALDVPAGETLLGIDELAWHPSGLIAVQNGTEPKRILKLPLERGRITDVVVLASNLPSWEEPTLGTVVGDRFYFVATSQWNRFQGADLPPAEELVAPLIQWVDLARP